MAKNRQNQGGRLNYNVEAALAAPSHHASPWPGDHASGSPARPRIPCNLLSTFIALAIACLHPLMAADPPPDLDLGPLYDRFPLTLELGSRTEAVGPLISYERRDTETIFGLHPLFSWRSDSITDFAEFDIVYPVLTYNRFGPESRFQIFQFFSFGGSRSQADSEAKRFTLFPFIFYQDSPDPEKDYFAFFPFYGHLRNRLLRDEIHFVLFPAYSKTRKNDVVTWNYLYPFFHLRRGTGLEGWQFWPLVGSQHKEVTSIVNMWDETVIDPGHDKLFILWPFFFRNQLGLGSENPQRQLLVLPLLAVQRSPLRDSTSAPWPLGITYTVDREKQFREWGAPWPLVVFARGEGKTINRVWPLFSQARNPTQESNFYLWPIYKFNRITSEPLDRRRTRILLFLYSDLIEANTQTGTSLHRTDLWPLFTARRDHEGNERLQLLAPLEPLLPNNLSMERNYSPLWSVWRSEKNARTGQQSSSFLWNLYRSDTTPDTREVSLLFGLFRYRSTPEGRQWRVFYVPFGTRRPSANAAPAEAAPEIDR